MAFSVFGELRQSSATARWTRDETKEEGADPKATLKRDLGGPRLVWASRVYAGGLELVRGGRRDRAQRQLPYPPVVPLK
jgi:hypothetical protein